MSENLSVWRTVFKAFDRDNNGRIDRGELTRALKHLGGSWSEERITEALDSYDADASGALTFEEFLLLVTGQPPPADPELVRAFRAMDTDGDGAITASELQTLFNAAGVNAAEEVRRFVEEGDLNGDGRITFDEFVRLASPRNPLIDDPNAEPETGS